MTASNGPDSYVICATPRSGSTLLCGLLSSTGLAGRPESYFRVPDEQSWADRWQIPRDANGRFDYRDYARAAVAAGSTANGLFAARVMWGTLGEMIAKLAASDMCRSDLEILTEAFGRMRFVHLWRDNTLAQAVSWLRAEQTHSWQHGDAPTGHEPRFDAAAISSIVRTISEHNAAWRTWFSSVGVQPYDVTYEELVADMSGVTRAILEHLGYSAATVEISRRHERLGDDINLDWISRYRALAESAENSLKRPGRR